MGAICQLFQAAGFILGSQACIVCRDTPTAAATSVTVRPSLITASTARYRCSATLISLIRECQGSTGTDVKHQPEPCKAPTGTRTSSIKRSNTQTVVGPVGLEPTTRGL